MSSPQCKQEQKEEQRKLTVLEKSADYLCLLAFLEKFSVPLGLYEYSLRSLETGLLSKNEVFTSLGMQELHFQLLKRIQVGRSITRSRVVRFLWKFANREGLSSIADTLHKNAPYESLPTELRLQLLRALIDCQLDENNRFRHFVSEQPSECTRSLPNGKDRHGLGYWFFQDSELSVRLFTENLTDEERAIVMVARDVDSLGRVLDGLVLDSAMLDKFESWIPLDLPEESLLKYLLQAMIYKVHAMGGVTIGIQEELKKKPPETKKKRAATKRGRQRKTKRRAAQKAARKTFEENLSSETTTDDDESDVDFLPSSVVGRRNRDSEESVDCAFLASDVETICRKCNQAQADSIVLLCDGCNDPYHPDCLVPPMVDIPEGDWFCPLCEQKKLCEFLSSKFTALVSAIKEREQKRAESALKRQNRLASVEANLDNLLKRVNSRQPNNAEARMNSKSTDRPKRRYSSPSSSGDNSHSTNSEESFDEQSLGPRKCRVRSSVNYRFDDYEAALKAAIGDSDSEQEPSSAKSDEKISRRRTCRNAVDDDEDFEIDESISNGRSRSSSLQSSDSVSSDWPGRMSDSDDSWGGKSRATKRNARRRRKHTGDYSDGGWQTPNAVRPLRRSTRQSALNRRSYRLQTGLTSSEEKSEDELKRARTRPIESSSSSLANEPDEQCKDLMWQRRMELNQFTNRQAAKGSINERRDGTLSSNGPNRRVRPILPVPDRVILNPLAPPSPAPFVRPYVPPPPPVGPFPRDGRLDYACLSSYRSSLTRGLLQQPRAPLPRAIRTIGFNPPLGVVPSHLFEDVDEDVDQCPKTQEDDDAFMIKNILRANMAEDAHLDEYIDADQDGMREASQNHSFL